MLVMPLAMDVLMDMSRRLVAVLVAVMGMSRRLMGVLMLMLVLVVAAHGSSLLSCIFYIILTIWSVLVKPPGFSGVIGRAF